ncbi:gp16 family protein [Serratia sp. JSRIV004]|uniref:gp16 family protein n=1 Tax=Serratia sp. JSRIV004 TaxID=2831895 RepID=UPI001CBB492D|nr:regulatory protein GemA [Serratia sp. JSRIV004]UAN55463.1 regulatory protein GemA [Serratia sp. JSRIV004]UAN57276.1 regulatory protein GemA [Serratia sp. JSRIV004]
MTPNAKKLIGAIKAGQAFLGWDDTTYRQTLERLIGKTSATRCSLEELQTVKEYMHTAGFPRQSKKQGRRPSVASSHKGLLSKVEALLADAGRPWSYAVSMAKHMFNRERVDWLTTDELTRLMQALVIDAKRRGKHENHRQP